MGRKILYTKGPIGGEIWSASSGRQSGQIKIGGLSWREKLAGGRMLLANVLITLAVFGIFYYALPIVVVEARYRLFNLSVSEEELTSEVVLATGGETEAELAEKKESIFYPVDVGFGIVIPRIGVNARVVSEVDPTDKAVWQEALLGGVAHAAGSYLPGEGGTVYLFSHSTDYLYHIRQYSAFFYLLKELRPEDEVRIYYREQRYDYRVVAKKVVKPTAVSEINEDLERDQLILQTCWPPGTTWERLLVVAEPVGEKTTETQN